MNKTMCLLAAVTAMAGASQAETVKRLDREVFVHEANYDESKVALYTLEDPLTFLDGRKVTKETWAERRKEILGIFAKRYNLAFAGYAAVALGLRGDGDTADFSGGIAWIPLCRCD